MNPTVAARTLGAIASIWPNTTIGEQTTEAWAVATPDVPEDVAHAAVLRLARTDGFAPSIARFMDHVRLIEREQAPPSIGPGPADSQLAQDRIRFLRVAWLAAAADRPDHDHRTGDGGCPRCSTSRQWVREMDHEILLAMFDEVPR